MSERVSGGSAIDWGASIGPTYSLCEVVMLTDVTASSIHHYRRMGLVPEPHRTPANRFEYDDRHIVALRTIRSLRRRGRSLDEIRATLATLLRTEDGGHAAIDLELVGQVADTSPAARLLDAAIDAFSTQSYGQVSLGALCAQAGVAKATFYRCFGSKDALFLDAARAVVDRAVAGFAAEMDARHPTDQAAAFAAHLRPGLPMLLELGKRSAQEPAATVGAMVTLFADLAARVGRAAGHNSDLDEAAPAGGLIIVLAVVTIFEELLRTATAAHN